MQVKTVQKLMYFTGRWS